MISSIDFKKINEAINDFENAYEGSSNKYGKKIDVLSNLITKIGLEFSEKSKDKKEMLKELKQKVKELENFKDYKPDMKLIMLLNETFFIVQNIFANISLRKYMEEKDSKVEEQNTPIYF